MCYFTLLSSNKRVFFFLLDRRGSMCLKGQNSSEEDTLYSEIDYIV